MDYRFAIRCWQDQAGDENAKANIFVNGVQIITEHEVTATSADTPQIITWESTGLDDPGASTSVSIRVVLANEYYLDAATDRNIFIDGIGYLNKQDGTNYKKDGINIRETVTDFSDFDNYVSYATPTAVTGDQIADDWWTSRENNAFYTIPIFGSYNNDNGVTITFPIQNPSSTS